MQKLKQHTGQMIPKSHQIPKLGVHIIKEWIVLSLEIGQTEIFRIEKQLV